jgi:hypothetical protein
VSSSRPPRKQERESDHAVMRSPSEKFGLVSKFQSCLPKEAEGRLLVERLLDVDGNEACLF